MPEKSPVHRPAAKLSVPAVIGGQPLGDQMIARAAAPGDEGCEADVLGLHRAA